MATTFGHSDTVPKITRFPASLKVAFFQADAGDGRPLFASPAKLADKLTRASTHYQKKSLEALFSQIFRGSRPVPKQLREDIISLINTDCAMSRDAVFLNDRLLPDLEISFDHHNESVRKSSPAISSVDSQFVEACANAERQVIFVCEHISHARFSPESPWTKLLHRQAEFLVEGMGQPLNFQFITTSKMVALSVWQSINSYTREVFATRGEEMSAEQLSKLYAQWREDGRVVVSTMDMGSSPPCLVSQAAFFHKRELRVFTLLSSVTVEMDQVRTKVWQENLDKMLMHFDKITDVSWTDYCAFN